MRKNGRLREDGAVWCPRCCAFRDPGDFAPGHPSAKGVPFAAYCRPCSAARQREYRQYRVRTDPAWEIQRQERNKPYNQARKRKRSTRDRRERQEIFNVAYATLRERGMKDAAISRATGITRNALRRWRRATHTKGHHDIPERMAEVAFRRISPDAVPGPS
jgi:hypothetical protein